MKNNKFNNFEFLRIYKCVEIKNKACEYSQMDVSFSLGIKPCAKKRFITFALLFCIYEKINADCACDVARYVGFRGAGGH